MYVEQNYQELKKADTVRWGFSLNEKRLEEPEKGSNL